MDAYKLKLIAIIGMVTSHMVITWWDIIPQWLAFPMYAAGGLTFPIMAFFVAEGYKHTSNLKRYILRLSVIAVIALPFHIFALSIPMGGGNLSVYPFLNIIFTIILSLFVLVLYDKIKIRALFWLMYVVLIVPIAFLFEWYFIGVTMVLMYHIIRNENVRRIAPSILAGVFFFITALFSIWAQPVLESLNTPGLIANADFVTIMLVFPIGCFLAGILLRRYNGERGKQMKYLFYVFYPLHLVILSGVALVL